MIIRILIDVILSFLTFPIMICSVVAGILFRDSEHCALSLSLSAILRTPLISFGLRLQCSTINNGPMFYPPDLLARHPPLGQIWMAGMMHGKINQRRLDELDINSISIVNSCDKILQLLESMNLRLSRILMDGVLIVYQQQLELLFEDANHLNMNAYAAYGVKAVPDPTVLPKGRSHTKYEAIILPDNNGTGVEDIERSQHFSGTTSTLSRACPRQRPIRPQTRVPKTSGPTLTVGSQHTTYFAMPNQNEERQRPMQRNARRQGAFIMDDESVVISKRQCNSWLQNVSVIVGSKRKHTNIMSTMEIPSHMDLPLLRAIQAALDSLSGMTSPSQPLEPSLSLSPDPMGSHFEGSQHPNFDDNEIPQNFDLLVETGSTQTQHPIITHPIDEITDAFQMNLRTYFERPGAPQTESLNKLARGMDPEGAAGLFYQTCDLASCGFLSVEQENPYENIQIFKANT